MGILLMDMAHISGQIHLKLIMHWYWIIAHCSTYCLLVLEIIHDHWDYKNIFSLFMYMCVCLSTYFTHFSIAKGQVIFLMSFDKIFWRISKGYLLWFILTMLIVYIYIDDFVCTLISRLITCNISFQQSLPLSSWG